MTAVSALQAGNSASSAGELPDDVELPLDDIVAVEALETRVKQDRGLRKTGLNTMFVVKSNYNVTNSVTIEITLNFLV